MSTTTLEAAHDIMRSKSCQYYDYTDKSQEEWQQWLENSEVNHYEKLSDDIYVNICNHCQVIKNYSEGMIRSWTV